MLTLEKGRIYDCYYSNDQWFVDGVPQFPFPDALITATLSFCHLMSCLEGNDRHW